MSKNLINTKFFTFLFFILLLLTLLFIRVKAQAFEIPSRTILVSNQLAGTVIKPTWSYLDKLQEAKDMVASSSFNLKVGKKDIIYYENRITRDNKGNVLSTHSKKLTDPEREILLFVLDLEDGDIDQVKITERGNDIISTSSYQIENVQRPNGITNNAWNTCRRIIKPENKAIILNVWPHYVTKKVPIVRTDKRGKKTTVYQNKEVIENVVYAPYCDQIHLPEFVEKGRSYRKSIAYEAYKILADRKIMSRAFPGVLISDVGYLKPEYFERLPLVEHMDFGEFSLNSRKSAERVDVILGTNLDQAYNLTCSNKSACGWLQYTQRTWNSMRSKYPEAKLSDFQSGVKDHTNSMVAAILLHDNNLQAAIKEFGHNILRDPDQLEEMLAANYNGGTIRPHKALKASILKQLQDWLVSPMRAETKQYIEKLRFIRTNY